MSDAVSRTVLVEQGMDPEFMDQVHGIPGGGAIKRCIQCGTCAGTCPVGWAMEHSPRQIVAMIRAGMRDEVLSSSTIWTCASCYACTVRCPQEIKITDVMYILKRLAMRHDGKQSRPAAALSRIFVDIVNRRGRNSEVALMLRFMLATRPLSLLRYGGIGWRLTTRGRLPLTGERIRGLEGLRRIIARAQEIGGES